MKKRRYVLGLPLLAIGLFYSINIYQLTGERTLTLGLIFLLGGTSYFIYYLDRSHNKKTVELLELQKASISALVELAQTRDDDVTGSHLHRLGFYADILARDLNLSQAEREIIVKTIALHDIGKVAVPDHILQKPGPLDVNEWEVIKQHPVTGAQVINSIASNNGLTNPEVLSYLTIAKEITLNHHEKWDGSGYPQGLKGEEIPLSARITAICDVYDSLRSPRPYKRPFSHDEAVAIITSGKGTHFDPLLVKSFLRLEGDFAKVWDEYGEEI